MLANITFFLTNLLCIINLITLIILYNLNYTLIILHIDHTV